MATQQASTLDETRVEEFAEKVAADQSAGEAAVLAYIGDRLGLWSSLATAGPSTPDELAERTGLDPTYLAEWLAAQAAAQYVEYRPDSGKFHLPAEHAVVLADEDSAVALAGGFEFQAGCWADADRIADLFVTGGGIPWGERDPRLLSGVSRFFRPLYRESLIQQWLPALDGVVPKLENGARVLDVGCGQGLSTILMGTAFPESTFVGIDPDEGSVQRARAAAREAAVHNVSFRARAVADVTRTGWDLVCFLDAFHHIGDPLQAARLVHDALDADGKLMLVEPLAKDTVADNLVTAGAVYYSASTIVCLPDALSQPGGWALGAQAGPHRLQRILTDAGFTDVRVAATTEFNLVIEAKP